MQPHSSLTLITPPVGEPLTVADVYTHLRLPEEEDSSYISGLITTARQYFEDHDDRRLLTQTWKVTYDYFPCTIELPLRPVQTVSFVKYYDGDGVLQTLDTADYQVDLTSFLARINPAYNTYWPSSRCQPNAVEVQFVVGYGDGTLVDNSAFDDADYKLTEIIPSWVTSWGITDKTTTGFTIRFNTAAPADATLKYTAENGNPPNAVASAEVDITLNALEQEITFPSPLPTVSTIIGGVPKHLKHALLLLIGDWYENREDSQVVSNLVHLPIGYQRLVGANRRMNV